MLRIDVLMNQYLSIVSKFAKKNILVLGDLILDQYLIGSVSRISPEAPVPVVLQEKSFFTPGGAANVANNLRSLGAKVTIAGRIGKDQEGKVLKRELKKKGISNLAVFVDRKVPTVLKTRIIARHQQMVRIDRESADSSFDPSVAERIKKFIDKNIQSFDGIIISDYGKGLITPDLVSFVCRLALKKKKIITVDPKVEHFSYYSGVTAITPNRKEAENAIRNIKIRESAGERLAINSDRLETMHDIDIAGKELLRYLRLESLLITLGEQGMRLFERDKPPVSIDTKAKEVFDVTGAGDAVIAVFTLALTAQATKYQAADIANHAAGIVVGKMGAVAVTKQELLQSLKGS